MSGHSFVLPTFLTRCATRCCGANLAGFVLLLSVFTTPLTRGAVGDAVETIVPQAPTSENFFSVGLAFVGNNPDPSRDGLYVNRNGDSTIYLISPLDGSLIQDRPPFDTIIPEWPAAMSYDAKRNGLWIGTQKSVGGSGFGVCGDPMVVNADMPIYFWSFDDDSVTLMFTIPFGLTNPATGRGFFKKCRLDGLVYDENEPSTTSDDEIWFSDMVSRNIGVFGVDGLFLRGFDASTVDGSLTNNSTGLAFGAEKLYLTNDGVGDVFRANQTVDSLTVIDEDPSTPDVVDPLTSGNGWLTDMACDRVTFAPVGKTVMWVRTSLNCILTEPSCDQANDIITAYEIEPGGCGAGPQLGACCDPNNPPCQDLPQSSCQGTWTAGVLCADLNPPCFETHRVILLDRTGSMENAVLADGRTRCIAAWETANSEIMSFFTTHPIGSSVAVWTFAGSTAVPLTAGFVDQASALAALAPLGNTPCEGWTPLSEAVCDSVDALVAAFPAAPMETLEVSISSDGLENNSDGPCTGFDSTSGSTCTDVDPFDPGSWQRLVCDHAVGNAVMLAKLWGDTPPPLFRSSQTTDTETGQLLSSAGVSDAVFFRALADATGGTFTFIEDNPPPPSGPPAFGVTGACCLPDDARPPGNLKADQIINSFCLTRMVRLAMKACRGSITDKRRSIGDTNYVLTCIARLGNRFVLRLVACSCAGTSLFPGQRRRTQTRRVSSSGQLTL